MNESKNIKIVLIVLALALAGANTAFSQNFGGMMGGSSGPWGRGSARTGDPIDITEAKALVENYLGRYYRSEDFEVLEIMEFDLNLYAVVGKPGTGTAAMELLVDPYSGAVFPEYGPNMMWNTEFGMMGNGRFRGMGGMMGGRYQRGYPGVQGDKTEIRVSAAEAVRLAQEYLDRVSDGARADDHVTTFPGYYTLHTLERGKITGMLSVNAYDGAVWYHSWHGAFKGEEEFAD